MGISRVESLSDGQWLVTVNASATTQHRVRLSAADLRRLGGDATEEELLEASFRFLLDREPNTAILAGFDLTAIGRYFTEYERDIVRYLRF